MTRVRFEHPMASPTRSARAGQVLDLPPEEAARRVEARQCVYTDDAPSIPDETAEAAKPAGPEADKPLEKRTVDQLKVFAAEQEIDLGDASKKAEILDRITTELARREAENDD